MRSQGLERGNGREVGASITGINFARTDALDMPRDPDPQSLCDELWQLVERGPGENPGDLSRVTDAIGLLERASPNENVRARVRNLLFHFEEWFHDARWRSYGPRGERVRAYLHWAIATIRRELAAPTTTR
jgi:hypothetical protein